MISEFLKSEIFLMAVATINIILLILYICNCVKLKKMVNLVTIEPSTVDLFS